MSARPIEVTEEQEVACYAESKKQFALMRDEGATDDVVEDDRRNDDRRQAYWVVPTIKE